MQIKNSAKEYDVIIVGSGAGGGMHTKFFPKQDYQLLLLRLVRIMTQLTQNK